MSSEHITVRACVLGSAGETAGCKLVGGDVGERVDLGGPLVDNHASVAELAVQEELQSWLAGDAVCHE